MAASWLNPHVNVVVPVKHGCHGTPSGPLGFALLGFVLLSIAVNTDLRTSIRLLDQKLSDGAVRERVHSDIERRPCPK